MAPHSGVGGWAPRPRKLRDEAVRIEVPMRIVKYTMAPLRVPGMMWTNMIRLFDAPMLLAART